MRRKDREVTDLEQIENILKPIKTCRLAMVDKGQPYVIPLSHGYAIDGDKLILYFHSAKEGRKIDVLKENSAVCFEISTEGEASFGGDAACSYGYYFSSVIGFGNAEFVEDIEEKCKALSMITQHQSGRSHEFTEKQADLICIFKVTSSDFTGKLKPKPAHS